jgi:hypothetical protein
LKKLLVLILLATIILLSVGCDKSTESSIQEISMSSIKDVLIRNLIQGWGQKNGAYLLEYGDRKNVYLFLNATNVAQGSKSIYFDSITVDIEANILNIKYTEKEIDQPNVSKNRMLYRIYRTESVDKIRIYRNGEETHFETIGAIDKR